MIGAFKFHHSEALENGLAIPVLEIRFVRHRLPPSERREPVRGRSIRHEYAGGVKARRSFREPSRATPVVVCTARVGVAALSTASTPTPLAD